MSEKSGKVHNLEEVNNKLKELIASWSNYVKEKFDLSTVIKFSIFALDQFIQVAKDYNIPGVDKKATVLSAFDRLYDFIVSGMPIWAKPIFIPIKQYVIYILASVLIDWVVSKYKDGSWGKAKVNELYRQKDLLKFPELDKMYFTD